MVVKKSRLSLELHIVVPEWEFPIGNSLGNLGFEFPISHGKKLQFPWEKIGIFKDIFGFSK